MASDQAERGTIMICILSQSRRRVERHRAWPTGWPAAVCSVAGTPSGFAVGFDELHQVDRVATSAALSALIALVQAGDDLAASLLLCVFAPAIRSTARRFGVGVGETAGELAEAVSRYGLATNAVPTVGGVVKDLRKRLGRRQARDQRRWLLSQSAHSRATCEETTVVDTRVDFVALVERLELSDAERALLALELDDRSVEQCATVFGVRRDAMYKRRRALHRLMRDGLLAAA